MFINIIDHTRKLSIRYYRPFACVSKSFYLRHDFAHNSNKTCYFLKVCTPVIVTVCFHRNLLNICYANFSQIVSSFAMSPKLLGAPTVSNKIRFV